jgi:hypothetical protein
MLYDGTPIYPLGSIQDVALQYFILKQQNIDARLQQTTIKANLLTTVLATHGDKTNKLSTQLNDLLGEINYYITYEDEELTKIEKAKEIQMKKMLNMVQDFNKKK